MLYAGLAPLEPTQMLKVRRKGEGEEEERGREGEGELGERKRNEREIAWCP
jgi:hypothetical protein